MRMLAQVTATPMRYSGRRKPKVSLAMVISQGLGGPKPMAKAAGEGQTVNIPSLPQSFDGVTEFSSPSGLLDCRSLPKEVG